MRLHSLGGMSKLRKAWLTPDTLPTTRRCWRVFCPDGIAYEAALKGALVLLGQEWNWQEYGTQTPEDVADLYRQSNHESFSPWVNCMPIGTVIYSARLTVPDNFLLCDGASYATADYPDLFDAIGYTFGGSGANFNVPDLRDKVAVGKSGTIAVGDTGGAKLHQLTVAELARHRHQVVGFALSILAPAGVLVDRVWHLTNPLNTTYVGSDTPHNNMQPYAGLLPCISYQ